MGAVKKYSATRLVADALKVDEKLIPESLRNKINTYKGNKTIPPEMFKVSHSTHYQSIDFKKGNLTYIRNLIILDTLFANTQKVKPIMLGTLSQQKKAEEVTAMISDLEAKKGILNALSEQLGSFKAFLLQDNLDLHHTELPNPFIGGRSIGDLLLAQIESSSDHELSTYDKILREYFAGKYQKVDTMLDLLDETTANQPEYKLLAEFVRHEIASAKSYHNFLKNL